jgi:hypothetical protein
MGKGNQRPCIAKCTMSVRKVMNVIFFNNQGPASQIAVPTVNAVNTKYNKGKVLHKLKKYFKKGWARNWSPWCQVVA